QPWMVKLRRMLGLFGFFYAALHLSIYTLLDRSASVRAVVEDVGKRPFITVGMASFVLLVPLALTSTQKMIKRLGGKRWNRLHRPLRVTEDGGLGPSTTRALRVFALRRRCVASTRQEIHDFGKQLHRVVIRQPARVNARVDANPQVAVELALQLIQPFFRRV